MVLAGFLSCHLTRQCLLGYSVEEGVRKESNCTFLSTIFTTLFHDHLNVGGIYCWRTRRLAIGDSGIRMKRYPIFHRFFPSGKVAMTILGSRGLRDRGQAAISIFLAH